MEELTARRRKKLANEGLLTKLSAMRRGDVLEFQVRLRPHRLFTMVHAIDSFAEMMDGRRHLFGEMATQVGEASSISGVMRRIMVGLVPLRGMSSNVSIVEISGELYLIDSRVVRPGSALSGEVRPFELVAVTEEDLYWKDLRRVLYAANDYTVYARVVNPGFQLDWNPVKLADLMGSVRQDFGDSFRELPKAFDEAIDVTDELDPILDVRVMMRCYADVLTSKTGVHVDESEISVAVTEAYAAFMAAEEDIVQQRSAFDIVTHAFERTSGANIDRSLVSHARTTALAQVVASRSAVPVSSAPRTPPSTDADQLEVEIVAIYW